MNPGDGRSLLDNYGPDPQVVGRVARKLPVKALLRPRSTTGCFSGIFAISADIRHVERRVPELDALFTVLAALLVAPTERADQRVGHNAAVQRKSPPCSCPCSRQSPKDDSFPDDRSDIAMIAADEFFQEP